MCSFISIWYFILALIKKTADIGGKFNFQKCSQCSSFCQRKGGTRRRCKDFGRVLGMNMGNWWMGQRGQIEDRVLKKLKKIDEAL